MLIGSRTSPQVTGYARAMAEVAQERGKRVEFLLWDPSIRQVAASPIYYFGLNTRSVTDISVAVKEAHIVFVAEDVVEFAHAPLEIKAGQKWMTTSDTVRKVFEEKVPGATWFKLGTS